MAEEITNYEYYLELITSEISRIFEDQKEYICCSNGCSLCCENGMYPFSEIEFKYAKIGYDNLPKDIKEQVKSNISELADKFDGKHFMYKCPFLINKSCAIYKYRGIICRTFGLITENAEGNLTIPYCAGVGLNYSKVYDTETKRILEENVKELGYQIMPKAYNLSRKNMMNLSIAKKLNIKFGESKMILEWFLEVLHE